MKFLLRSLIAGLVCCSAFAQITNQFTGQSVTNGQRISNVVSSGGGETYDPPTTDLVSRYRASSSGLSANGTKTNRWFDSVGVNHLNSYYAPDAYHPFYTNVAAINSKGAFQFGPAVYEQMWTNTSTTLSQPVTIYAVCQFNGGSGTDPILVGSSSSTGAYIKPVNVGGWAMSGGTQISGGAWETGKWYIVEARLDGSASYLMTNNVISIATNNAGSTGLKLISVGNSYANLASFKGGIAEILLYNSRPDATARTSLSNYFRQYYNLP